MQLRASSLPLLKMCQASARLSDVPINTSSPEAELGTAFHHGQALMIEGRYVEADVLARMHGVGADDLGFLLRQGERYWRDLSPMFPEPFTELGLASPCGTLTGHADVISFVADEVRVIDWKSGAGDGDHHWQLMGYALMALAYHPRFNSAYVAVVRVRDGTVDGERWTREELAGWWEAVRERLDGPTQFNPGRHCGYCPHAATCGARASMLRSQAQLLRSTVPAIADEPALLGEWHGRELVELLDAARAIEALTGSARDLIRSEVQRRGGSIPTGEGRELALVEQPKREIIWPAAAPVLRRYLSQEEIDAVLRCSTRAVEKTLKGNAHRGAKGGRVADCLESLASAGALETTTIQRLEARRVPVPR